MLKIKLLRYYERLIPFGLQKGCWVTLGDITDKLCTTIRHARNLINQMQDMKWVVWQPGSGRGHRSLLFLNYDLNYLQDCIALECIEQDLYDKALSVLGEDKRRLGVLLKTASVANYKSGQLYLRLTYYRPFFALLPHTPQKNSERFLLRQIYSCLTQCDENGVVTAQLSHHWANEHNGLQWYFYLRPDLSFHNGDVINAEVISNLFSQLKNHPEYKIELEHLVSVSAVNPLCVKFVLSETDLSFPGLVSDVRYSIQPPEQLTSKAKYPVVGSGFFQVQEHSENSLYLSAFHDFYGCRALPEHISIWHVADSVTTFDAKKKQEVLAEVPKLGPSYVGKVQLRLDKEQHCSPNKEHIRLEYGCQFLLFNLKASASPLNHEQRQWLSSYLSPNNIIKEQQLDVAALRIATARNLLHCWQPISHTNSEKASLPALIEMAVYDQSDLKHYANAIISLLKKCHVCCIVHYYSLVQMQHRARANLLNEQIILTSVNFDDNRPISLFRWFYADPLFRVSLSNSENQWFFDTLKLIRRTQTTDKYDHALESLACEIIDHHWLIPLFHHWQVVLFQDEIQGVSISNWGWPELKNIWIV